jgi:hypothetical protein
MPPERRFSQLFHSPFALGRTPCPTIKNSMQTRPAAVNPLRLRGFAAPASVAGQLRRRRINSKLTRRREDDSK